MLIFIKKLYSQLIGSVYLRNIFILSSGVGSSQVIALLLLPFLTRFFSPNDFGVFAVFMSIIQLIAISATFRLEMAIVLPKKDSDAVLLCLMSLFSLTIFSLITSVIIFIITYYSIESSILDLPIYALYLIPIGSFFMGFYNILYSWNNRLESYKNMSYSHILHSCISTPSSFLFYFLSLGSIALILGQIIGRFFACALLMKSWFNKFKEIDQNKMYNQMCFLWNTYNKFPKFELPQTILNFMSQKYIVAFFTLYSTTTAVGVFDLADKILGKPLAIISNSFKTVFYQRLTTAQNKKNIFIKSLALMMLIGIVLTIPFYYLPDTFFIFILGDEWGDTGRYIQLICPLIFSRFVFTVVSPTISYTLKNHLLLFWQIIYFVSLVVLFSVFSNVQFSNEHVLLTYSMLGAFMYTLLGVISYLVLIKNIKN